MPKYFTTFFAITLLSLAACADGGDDGSGPLNPPAGFGAAGGPAPVTPPSTSASTPSRSSTTALVVQNRYPNQTVTGVFLSPSYEDQWGSNQLNGRLLPPGEDLTLSQIPCDEYYDLKITGSNGSNLGIVKEIYFACGIEKLVTLSR